MDTPVSTNITGLDVYRVAVPLKAPYRLSFTEVRRFDSVLIRAEDDEGHVGWGEATLLTGYTDETVDQSYSTAERIATEIAGRSVADALNRVDASIQEAPFTATALRTAMEMMIHDPLLRVEENTYVPLLSLIHGDNQGDLEQEIESELSKGYRTFKVKVGFDVDKDLERVNAIQRIVAGRAQIRIDANQGFDENEACRFASSLSPDGIELLEQTCAAGDWNAARKVARVSEVPLMLDESIYNLEDVDRAADLGAASFIKFKLMKAGGAAKLLGALNHIRDRGMTPVLGNGVACDLGCWMEACIAARALDNAGEMNGFLKTTTCLLEDPIEMVGGEMVLPKEFIPRIDQAAVDAHTRNHVRVVA